MTTRYPIRIGARSRLLLRVLFGVTSETAWAEISDDAVTVRFGRVGVATGIENVTGWRIEGPWRWITAIGVRMNVFKRDVSFCGSPRGGVRLAVRRPIPWGPLRIVAVYCGVEDLDAFAADLSARGIAGQDARTGSPSATV